MLVTRTVVLPMEDDPALALTLQEAHRAYRMISEIAHRSKTYARYPLQKMAYAEVRATTMLTAQMTCSAIRRVSAAYKSMKSSGRLPEEPARFSKRSLELEGGSRGRDFRLYPEKALVSISTAKGRKKVRYRCGSFQRAYLESPHWAILAARLLHKRRRKGWRYELHVTVARDGPERKSGDVLGVDTGRHYLAVASTGRDAHFFPAGHLKPKKEHFRRLRGKLSSKGTRSSTRTFIRASGREARLTTQFQHETANALVRLALDSRCAAIAVERLNGIRERTGARSKKARYHHGTWAYGRFLAILRYKAEAVGLEIVQVAPENTSRACDSCGGVDKANRRGLLFACIRCGYSLHADLNAARNIRLRAISGRQVSAGDGLPSCSPKADPGSIDVGNGKPLASAGGT